jgi:glucose-1-phosphate adenylyltransferase
MTNLHGIIYAYHSYTDLGSLVARRTAASLPFGGRYRLIDFSMSAMMNAGVRDVGVIMQRDYQSLLDHLGSGKDWDLSRRSGGLRLLPPFGLPDSHLGEYKGCMEALSAVSSYIEDIKQDYVVLSRGDLCANIDLVAVMRRHLETKVDITAVCSPEIPSDRYHGFVVNKDGISKEILCRQRGKSRGIPSLEVYIISKSLLLDFIRWSTEGSRLHFHRDALTHYLAGGGRVGVYVHGGYAAHVTNVKDYYKASMDSLKEEIRTQLFPEERPVRTKERADVSTYYGDSASSRNSLLADGCYIEGEVEDCILFRGVRVGKGARLRGCVIMQDTVIGENATLAYVISDKDVNVSRYVTLAGSPNLPLVIPKGGQL